ncbi:HAD superfamily hydrolase [Streptococcus pneumoniae]|nr:HAD superfamily hydrolase [Streptococcus pneumoniae]
MDAKLRYKAKKIKIVFFDIDDTLRNSKTGFIPTTIPTVFKQLREKGILTGIASGRGIFGVVPEIRDLKPDFFVTLNGAYIEDKKVRSFISIRLKSHMLRSISLGLSKKELSMAWLGVMMPSCRLAPI